MIIEQDVPIPPKHGGKYVGVLRALEVGQSVVLPMSQQNSCYLVWRLKTEAGSTKQFTTRVVSQQETRVWRTE
jgi:hypothetical protein